MSFLLTVVVLTACMLGLGGVLYFSKRDCLKGSCSDPTGGGQGCACHPKVEKKDPH